MEKETSQCPLWRGSGRFTTINYENGDVVSYAQMGNTNLCKASTILNKGGVLPRCTKGAEFLPDILMATEQRRVMEIYHQSFESSLPALRLIEPYGIKEFKGRWYLLAYDTEKKGMRTFGLDRIRGVRMLSQKFFYKDSFNIADYFKHYFGIVSNNMPPERIVLSIDVLYGKYLETRPLHHSQRIVAKDESECYVELYLVPTYDFVQELLSMFGRVIVIEPLHLKEEIGKLMVNFER